MSQLQLFGFVCLFVCFFFLLNLGLLLDGFKQIAGVYGHKALVEFVEHLQLGFAAALMQSRLFQGVHDGVDAESLAVPV